MSLKKAFERIRGGESSDDEFHGRTRRSARSTSPKDTTATKDKRYSLTFPIPNNTHNTRATPTSSQRSSFWSRRSGSSSPTHTSTTSPSPTNSHHSPRGLGLRSHKSHTACTGSASSSLDRPLNDSGLPMSKNQHRKFLREKGKELSKKLADKRESDRKKTFAEMEKEAEKNDPEEVRRRYGVRPVHTSAESDKLGVKRMDISGLSAENEGEEISFRARVHARRTMGSKLVFFIFRQQITTVQGVLHVEKQAENEPTNGERDQSSAGPTPTSGTSESRPSKHMLFWAGHLAPESVVLVKGRVRKPKEVVKATTVHDVEIQITELHVLASVTEHLPFDVYEAENLRGGHLDTKNTISTGTRLDKRVLDLRTSASNAIFRINSAITNLFRAYLDSQGFIEIHTPKLQGAATESGSSVFQLNYFGRPAFLAQSPQLAKQMAIAADLERVYEVGPVFRAENSNTKRHLTEYTGLDLEMAIEENYHEALDVIDGMFKAVFKGIYEKYGREVEAVSRSFPVEKLVWLDETPRIPFKEGIKMLRDSGYKDEGMSEPPSELEDLSTRAEIRLGELVKEKYKTDFYILDKFPAAARPFYTMPNPEDPKKLTTNSYDIFIRGQEVLSGGQRIHDAKMLEKNIHDLGLNPDTMKEYIDGFRWGCPPHAGGGVGLERVVMLLLDLGNIRLASLFPRDPKSLPKQPAPAHALRHPEASTMIPPWVANPDDPRTLQPLEKLIANYGDAGNTSWLDDRFVVWRDEDTGAAVGYVPSEGYAVTIGDPLCDESQKAKVIVTYVRHLRKHAKLKPVWMLCSEEVQKILGKTLGWSTLTCASEERVDTMENPAQHDQNIQRKIRHAEKEGVTITEIRPPRPGEGGEYIPSDVIVECDERIRHWLAHRKGRQAHLTQVRPWADKEHRRYWYARDKNGKICALAVLAQLAPQNGYQFKFALDFPGAPNGTIEMIIMHVLRAAAASGIKKVTFGTGATNTLTPGYNLSGVKTKLLTHSYKAIASALKLVEKSEFREKLGAEGTASYVCYPKNSLRWKGITAIIKVVEAEE